MIIGSQEAIFHDCGFAAGFFHIFDHFQTDDPPLSGRRIDVFLPRDYGQSRNRYPVLYMNDGGTAFVPGGLVNESWNMADAIERLYEMGKISQLIVVAIYPLSRAWEYTHAAWSSREASGGLDRYAHCVADCIKPFILWTGSIGRFQTPSPRWSLVPPTADWQRSTSQTVGQRRSVLPPHFRHHSGWGSMMDPFSPGLNRHCTLGLRSLSSLSALNTHCRTVASGQGSISPGGLFGLAGLATLVSKSAPLPDAEKWLRCCSIATATEWVMNS